MTEVLVATMPMHPAAQQTAREAVRLGDLDRAKGLAIVLVVFGHLVARDEPTGLTWYEPLRIAVYLFHMPFFMYLSGFVAFRFGAATVGLRQWPGLAARRAHRLLLPFALFGLAILLGKMAAAHLVQVDNMPPGLVDGLRAMLWDTAHSPAESIWYVAVLFVYAVATPLLLAASGGRAWLPLAVALVLYLVPTPPAVMYADRICRFYLFFVAGGLAARAGGRWLLLIERWRWPALVALAAVMIIVGSGAVTFAWNEVLSTGPYRWYMLVAGLLSTVALHGLMRNPATDVGGALALLGRYCFVIYLLNTIVIGAIKGVLLKFVTWDAAVFAVAAPALLIAGLLGPIVVKSLILRRFSSLDRMTS